MINEHEFSEAISSYLDQPSDSALGHIAEAYLLPIARGWAWSISFTREDREDATQDLLLHLLDLLRSERRARFDSPIKHKPVAGYVRGRGKAYAMFFQCAKLKSYDIVKHRVRKYRREQMIEAAERLEAAWQAGSARGVDPPHNGQPLTYV